MKINADNAKRLFNGDSRPCVHALAGRIEGPKICVLNGECHHCAFDQWLDEFDLGQIGKRSHP